MVVSAPKRLDDRPIFQSRYDNFIGGKWVAPHNRQYSDNLSPINGKSLCQIPRSSAEDIELALGAAHKAQEKYGVRFLTRSRLLLKDEAEK